MKVNEAVTAVMAAVGAVAKSRQNAAQNYRFRGIDDIYASFQPLLAEHGVLTLPSVLDVKVEERENAKGTILRFVLLTVKYTIVGPEGDMLEAVVVGEAMDSSDKAANKAMSAAHKYLFLQVFCPPTEIDDADSQSHELAARKSAGDEEKWRKRVAEVRALADSAGIRDWVKDQGFPWPWPFDACDAIEAKANAALEAPFSDPAQQELAAVGAGVTETPPL